MRPLTKRRLLIAIVSLGLPMVATAADLARPVPEAALLQAHVSLHAQQQLTTAKTFKSLGFASPDEAKRSTLGTPMRIFAVRLDKLKAYTAERDAKELLEDTNAVRYPVLVGKEVRSGVVVREIGRTWQIESIGRPALTKALTSAASVADRPDDAPRFVVSIPALRMYFVGHLANGELGLTPVLDDPRFNLKASEALPAAKVFAALVPYAKSQESGPYLAD